MNDIKFHIENIKRSIHAIADLNLEDPDNRSALVELTAHPIFQMLFNVTLQFKDIYERELSELIGLEHGSITIAQDIFKDVYSWGFNTHGDFSINQHEGIYRSPLPTFIFRIVEKDDEFDPRGLNVFKIGFMRTGENIVHQVKFITCENIRPQDMVAVMAKHAPDFKVFVTKQ